MYLSSAGHVDLVADVDTDVVLPTVYPDEYVKVTHNEGAMNSPLILQTSLVLPIYSAIDRQNWQQTVVNQLVAGSSDLHMLLSQISEPVEVALLSEVAYDGLPEDYGQAMEAKLHPWGYWMAYWSDGSIYEYYGSSSYSYESWYGDESEFGSGGYESATEMVTHVISFYCSFELATSDSLAGADGLGLLYVTAVADSAGLGTERVKLWIYEGYGGSGIDFYTDVVFPAYQRESTSGYDDYGYFGRRRLSQAAAEIQDVDWASQVQELQAKLTYNPGEVFPLLDFMDYGVAQISSISQWDHTGPLYDYLEPLEPGTYESGTFDWLSPEIFFPSSGGGGSSGFMEETLVFSFDVHFEFVQWDDLWNLGPGYIDALESLISPLNRDYIKIYDFWEDDYSGGVIIYTALILPLEADDDYSFWQQVGQTLQYDPSLVFASLSGWGPVDVTYFYENLYTGLPTDPGASEAIVPNMPGYWDEYFSGDPPESGSELSYYTEDVTMLLSFRVDFPLAQVGQVSALGQLYVTALAEYAGGETTTRG
eukprot:scaffold530745_cov50-Prasinocladus_malaysianus.AAC.1